MKRFGIHCGCCLGLMLMIGGCASTSNVESPSDSGKAEGAEVEDVDQAPVNNNGLIVGAGVGHINTGESLGNVQHSPVTTSQDESLLFRVDDLGRPKYIVGENLSVKARHRAAMVFVRSSIVASAVKAQIFDMTNGQARFVGEIENNTQLLYELSPGRHVFMIMADSVDYIEVNVQNGYVYYALVKPSMGVWKPKFHFVPIKNASPDTIESENSVLYFNDESLKGKLSSMTPIVYAKEFAQRKFDYGFVVDTHSTAWPEWQEKHASHKDSKTLEKNDGRKLN